MNDTLSYDLATIMLSLCRFAGLGPRLLDAVMQRFGRLERILAADSGTLMRIEGMTAETANRIAGARDRLDEAEQYRKALCERDIDVKTRFDHDYPQNLLELNNPPWILYVRGRLPDNGKKRLAIAGTQDAGNDGIALTVKLAEACSNEGIQVISSLRKGINTAAHVGVHGTDGVSFAVFEAGFDQLDPVEQMPVAIDIAGNGGVISEHPPDHPVNEEAYEEANRLLVGMSQAVVVTEVYGDSRHTLDLLSCCSQVGKLTFLLIDPLTGGKMDESSLDQAVRYGAIPMVGLDKIEDIFKALV